MNFYISSVSEFKASNIFKHIQKNADSQKKQIIIVPELYSHQYERMVAKNLGNNSCRYVSVTNFKRLSRNLIMEIGCHANRVIDDNGRLLIMHKAISSVVSSLGVYNKINARAGFVKQVMDVIEEYKNADILPNHLLSVAEEIEDYNLKYKVLDLAQIYISYQNICSGIGDDLQDIFVRVRDGIKDSTYFDRADVFFDEFIGFTKLEYNIIEEIVKKADSVNFSMCYTDNNSERYCGTLKTLDILQSMCRRIGEDCYKIYLDDTDTRGLDIQYISKNLFNDGVDSYGNASHNISINKFKCVEDELQYVGSKIRFLVESQGYRYRDIAVVARDFTKYSRITDVIFNQYGISCYINDKSDITSKPIYILIFSALEILINNFIYDNVFTYLKTGLIDLDKGDINLLEDYVIRWGISGSEWFRDFYKNPNGYKADFSDSESRTLEHLNIIRSRIVIPLLGLKKDMRGGTSQDYASAIYKFMDRIGLGKSILRRIEFYRSKNMLKQADEYKQLWDKIIFELEQIVLINLDEDMDIEVFCEMFRLILENCDIGTIPVSLDRVNCGDMSRIVKYGVKVLFILGAGYDEIPKKQDECIILNDADRNTLASLDINISDSIIEKLKMEDELILSMINTPTDLIFMSYIIMGDKGEALMPALFISSIEEMLNISCVIPKHTYKLDAFIPSFTLACSAIGSKNDEIANFALSHYMTHDKTYDMINRFIGYNQNMVFNISDNNMLKELYSNGDNLINISATKISLLNNCEFAYFLKYGLRINKNEESVLRPLDIGNFTHYVLEKVLGDYTRNNIDLCSISDEEYLKSVREQISHYKNTIIKLDPECNMRLIYVLEYVSQIIEKVSLNIKGEIMNSLFNPEQFEMTISETEDGLVRGKNFEIDNMRFCLVGKVDRLDTYITANTRYIKVSDYKAGDKSFDLCDVLNGLDVQLMLYVDCIAESYKTNEFKNKIAAMLYVPTREVLIDTYRDINDDKLIEKKGRELLRSGLILNDRCVISALEIGLGNIIDNNVEKLNGEYIPIKFNKPTLKKSDTLDELHISKQCNGAVLEEDIEVIKLYINRVFRKTCEKIISGTIAVNPIKKSSNSTSCTYCEYNDVCKFNIDDESHRFRVMNKPPMGRSFCEEMRRILDSEL